MSPNRFRGSSGGSADGPDDAESGPLSHPAQLTRADPQQLSALTRDAEASGRTLRGVVDDPSAAPQDRVAAAVLLDSVLKDSGPLETLDPEAAAAPEAMALRFSPHLRPSAARALGGPVTMQLLTWAAQSAPGTPPVEAAEAAAHLGVDDDGRIYGRVSQRAVQISEQKGLSRGLKDRLRSLTDALGAADQEARRQRTAGPQVGSAADSPQSDDGPGDAAADSLDAGGATSDGAETSERPGTTGAPAAPGTPETDAPSGSSGSDERAPASWTSADDAALASMLGQSPSSSPSETHDGSGAGTSTDSGPGASTPRDDRASRDRPSDGQPEAGLTGDGGSTGTADPQETGGGASAPQAPDFGRPVGFDGGSSQGGSGAGGSGRATPAEPTGQWPPPPRPRDEGVDDRPGTGPGYGSTGTTGREAPRSYDFRYLGDDTQKPSTEAEKSEFRTTLRNWGIFALVLVLVMIIVGIII